MFRELFDMVNNCSSVTLEKNLAIPSTKKGAVIAETTSGLLHVMYELSSSRSEDAVWSSLANPRFHELLKNQLRWRLMLHLGFKDEITESLLDQLLPVLMSELPRAAFKTPATRPN